MRTIILLTISNVFMALAWYGHPQIQGISAVDRDYGQYSTAQLKTIQEVITLVVFSVFSVTYLREQFRWNYLVAFAFISGVVFFMFYE